MLAPDVLLRGFMWLSHLSTVFVGLVRIAREHSELLCYYKQNRCVFGVLSFYHECFVHCILVLYSLRSELCDVLNRGLRCNLLFSVSQNLTYCIEV